jgi:hypothetical protein
MTTTIREFFNEHELHISVVNGEARVSDAGSEITATGDAIEDSDEPSFADSIMAEDFEFSGDDDDDLASAWEAVSRAVRHYYAEHDVSFS